MKKFKDSLALCPEYSRFVLLWIINKHDASNDLEAQVRESMTEELRSEKVASLYVATLLSKAS